MKYTRPPGQPDFIAVLVYDYVRRKRIRYDSLAEMCGVHEKTLSQWFNGKSTLNSWSLSRVLLVLGYTVRQSVKTSTIAEHFRRSGYPFSHWRNAPMTVRAKRRQRLIDDALARAFGSSKNSGASPSSSRP